MLSENILKQVLLDQHEYILKKDLGIARTELSAIAPKIRLPHVHVITGIRRCGKSTFLRQIMERYYKNSGFYYINFEDERLLNFKSSDFNKLYELLAGLFGGHKTFFIDGIQNVEGFEAFVRRFNDNGFKFFITGSNSNLLSSEISGKLTGRHTDTVMKPFSFGEFLTLKKIQYSPNDLYKTTSRVRIKKHFNEYLFNGGMPDYAKYGDEEILLRTYEDIVLKDIFVRYNAGNHRQLRELYHFLISNFAQRFSYNSVNRATSFSSINSVIKYIGHLEQSYLIRVINKFDYSLKKQMANEKKLYVADNGFITKLSTSATNDHDWLLENLVFNSFNPELKVYYFRQNSECDFVLFSNKNVVNVIQVTWEINSRNEERELKGLAEAMDFFGLKKGLILTNEQEETRKSGNKTFQIKPVWKWLLENKILK